VVGDPSINAIRRIAAAANMITLKHDGFRKVREGITTIEEIFHIVGDS
jgi:type IV pilus assembly protein PilB